MKTRWISRWITLPLYYLVYFVISAKKKIYCPFFSRCHDAIPFIYFSPSKHFSFIRFLLEQLSKKGVLARMDLLLSVLFCFVIFLHFLSANSRDASPLAPALYVFGDSLFDSGNNNFLPTLARANYFPYGLNFPGGVTGRFTNGRTVADFIGFAIC